MRKLVVASVFIFAVFALSACGGAGSVKLTDQGQKVRVLSAKSAKACDFRGKLFASKTENEGGTSATLKELRNKAGAARGNAVLITAKREYRTYTEMVADVYWCGK